MRNIPIRATSTGSAEAMQPTRSYFDGSLGVVRPLYEMTRGELSRLARLGKAPVVPESCPAESGTRRARVTAALGALGSDQKRVRRQLFWAAVRQLGAIEDASGSARSLRSG